ncbi:MAG: hypothetical protein A2Z34_06805 [Planctomycetes bacterium RBG_16_59_8]|nr:MAG: hypothetical protein A2Z34_06805 [Planctomycetes bacterium RBG_16_59_8]
MRENRPIVHIIAGPNGAGKTTFAFRYLPRMVSCRHFINADLIARGLSPLDVDAAAIQSGRLFLKQVKHQIARKNSFAFEITLSGLGYLRLLQEMKRRGYLINIYFLWIPDVRLALKRIEDRVRLGGHDVPRAAVLRRYTRGMRHLFDRYLLLSDYSVLLDNSPLKPIPVVEYIKGRIRTIDSARYRQIQSWLEEHR